MAGGGCVGAKKMAKVRRYAKKKKKIHYMDAQKRLTQPIRY